MPDAPPPAAPSPAVSEARPFAWVIPGDDNARMDGWLDARITQDGEFTRPLYTREQLEVAKRAAYTEARRVVEGELLMMDPRRGLLEMRVWLYALVAKVGTVRLTAADLVVAQSVLIERTTDPDGTITFHAPALAGLTTTETGQ